MIADGWASRFGMDPVPDDFGRGVTHTREQVRAFHAPADLLLAYHDRTYEITKNYLKLRGRFTSMRNVTVDLNFLHHLTPPAF